MHFKSALAGAQFEYAVATKSRDSDIELVASGELAREFDGAAELHVPNGYRHISELTHALIGIELGRRILPVIRKNYAPGQAVVWRGHEAAQQ